MRQQLQVTQKIIIGVHRKNNVERWTRNTVFMFTKNVGPVKKTLRLKGMFVG